MGDLAGADVPPARRLPSRADARGQLKLPGAPGRTRSRSASPSGHRPDSSSVRFVDQVESGPDGRPVPQQVFGVEHEQHIWNARRHNDRGTAVGWREDFWKRKTPWGTDRRYFGGESMYETPFKPSAKNFSNTYRYRLQRCKRPLLVGCRAPCEQALRL